MDRSTTNTTLSLRILNLICGHVVGSSRTEPSRASSIDRPPRRIKFQKPSASSDDAAAMDGSDDECCYYYDAVDSDGDEEEEEEEIIMLDEDDVGLLDGAALPPPEEVEHRAICWVSSIYNTLAYISPVLSRVGIKTLQFLWLNLALWSIEFRYWGRDRLLGLVNSFGIPTNVTKLIFIIY